MSAMRATSAVATLDPAEGPILSRPTLSVTGLKPASPVEVSWITARDNRVTASGWSLQPVSLASAHSTDQGTLGLPVTIPDDLGGWHSMQASQDGEVVAQVPYFVQRCIAGVSPSVVKAGETVIVNLKGFGWTELDNGAAVTYDNASISYVRGFNGNGDAALQILATGSPGAHLIDLYPMLYQGRNGIKPGISIPS